MVDKSCTHIIIWAQNRFLHILIEAGLRAELGKNRAGVYLPLGGHVRKDRAK